MMSDQKKMAVRSSDVDNNLSVCCAHKSKTGSKESTQVITWKNSNKVLLHPARSRIQTSTTGFTVQCVTTQPQTPISGQLMLGKKG